MALPQSILDILVDEKRIDATKADEVRNTATLSSKSIEDILRQKQVVKEEDLQYARAKLLGVPLISLHNRAIAPDVTSFVPEAVARKYSLIPFEYDSVGGELSVAMVDPVNLEVIEFLIHKTGKRIKPYLATKTDVDYVIEEVYSRNLAEEVTAAVKDTAPNQIRTIEASRLSEVIREAPIARIVSTFLEYAIRSRASDIHIEPLDAKTRVRYRIDGILQEKLILPRSVHDAVVSRIKILSNLKIDEKRVPQDGRFNFKIGSDEVDIRISTLPTVHGEKVVMRLLRKSGGLPTLDKLGLRGTALRVLEQNILRPHGIILVTGPTGSGKTTTLYAVLSKINTTRINIVTLEDPVEYELPGVNQVLVNPQAGLTFSTGLRSFLRQDPNVILVGEIRDSETTSLAMQAALTGHLVFSTLHTSNAATAIPRLFDLKAEPFLIASTLHCIIAQRIVRTICSTCKEAFNPPPEIVQQIQESLGPLYIHKGPLTLYRGRGCKNCTMSGYLGRMGVFEVLNVSDTIARAVLDHETSTNIESLAFKEGMISMKQDGFLKVVEGFTTIEEVLRVAQD